MRAGFEEIVFDDPITTFLGVIKECQKDQTIIEILLDYNQNFNQIILYIRFLISAEIHVNKEDFDFYFENEK